MVNEREKTRDAADCFLLDCVPPQDYIFQTTFMLDGTLEIRGRYCVVCVLIEERKDAT